MKGQILICTAIMLNDHSNPYIESTTVLSDIRGGWKRSRDHALPHARLYILLIEKLFLLQRQVAC